MAITLMEPPESDHARRLLHFVRHKNDESLRGIRQRVLGQYVDHCVDRYFLGEVDGQLVGHAWYGLPRGGTGVGNFGHIYTDPNCRGEGIASHLCRVLVDHFNADPLGKCLLCSAGAEAGRIYRRLGFEFIPPTADSGPMGLVKGETFEDFERRAFAPGRPVMVRPGHVGDRHDLDRLLDFSPAWIAARQRWHFVRLASRVTSLMAALHLVEDGRGLVTVLQTADGSLVGWAFALRLGSDAETTPTVDLIVHPHYLHAAPCLLRETIQLSGADPAYASVATCDTERLSAFAQAGFVEQHCFAGQQHDVLLLRHQP